MNMKNVAITVIAIAGLAFVSSASDGGHPIKKSLKGTMHPTHIVRIPAQQLKTHPKKHRLPISPRPTSLKGIK